MPIIDLATALRTFAEVELWADDPAAWGDLHAFSEATGHPIVTAPTGGRLLQAVIRHKQG